jgi:sporulation protein YtfJ
MAFLLVALIAAAVLIFVACVLASRVRLRLRLAAGAGFVRFALVGRALFGLARIRLEAVSRPTKGRVRLRAEGFGWKAERRIPSDSRGWIGAGAMRFVRRIRRSAGFSYLPVWALSGARAVTCTRWRTDLEIGTGEAASTGVAAGAAWAVLGMAAGAASRLLKMDTRPRGGVRPDFQAPRFSLVWEADFRVPVYSLIGAFVRLRVRMLKRTFINGGRHAHPTKDIGTGNTGISKEEFAMSEHPIKSLMQTAMENIKEMVDVHTIVGEPVQSPDGSVILPISRVGFGFAAGGSDFSVGGRTEMKKGDNGNAVVQLPFGGGSGGGVSITPIAFLVVGPHGVKVVSLDHQTHLWERLIESVPQLIDRIQAMWNAGREEVEETIIFEPDMEEEAGSKEAGPVL